MYEIGGYIELDRYALPMLHEGALPLNCGRNALAYLIRTRNIKTLWIPKFLCDSVREVCGKENIVIKYYSIDLDFLPKELVLVQDEWLYVVNFYGQLENSVLEGLHQKYHRVIVDNVQAYYQMPVAGVDTIYTCRKFFGVADGAFLYTNQMLEEELQQDESFERMRFLNGRFERTASEFYNEYAANNDMFANEPIKRMSKLTENLLHAIDYDAVKKQRTDNYRILHEAFAQENKLSLSIPEGAFMYPLYCEGGRQARKILQAKKIYIPILWPDVFECCEPTELEYHMAENILPLPVDQRYNKDDMEYIIEEVYKAIR